MLNDIKKTADQKMQRALEVLKTDLGKVRTGRAHAGFLDQVMVEYYGNLVPILIIGVVFVSIRMRQARAQREIDALRRTVHAF